MIHTRRISRGAFVSATGTGVGKTFVTRGVARALERRGLRVAALKPIETGCAPEPADAVALARACGRPELVSALGFYRARPPLAPYAIGLEGGPTPEDAATLAGCVEHAAEGADVTLVEGAGGLFVPLRRGDDIADLVSELGLPVLLVARDRLGVLSDVRAALGAAVVRRVTISAVILTRVPSDDGDPSRRSNQAILAELGAPVRVFDSCPDDDDALADEAERAGIVEHVLSRTPRDP